MGIVRTIRGLVATIAESAVDSRALGRPEGTFVGYGDLLRQIEKTGTSVRSFGVGRGDVVAVSLPDGPDLASLFLGVSSASVFAPLNPGFREPECEFYLGDLKPALVVVPHDRLTPAEVVADRLGIPVARLSPGPGPGLYDLEAPSGTAGSDDPLEPDPDQVALILHTSGTTGRPKMVRLTHANLTASARNVARSLELGSTDTCLNVMPLFHIHGLVAAVLASLAAGASVVCTPGFDATRFFGWLEQVQPTWYTAVPTMHQAILERSNGHQGVGSNSLRLLRSSSSPLPPVVMARLEETFGVPVLEAYGMTEAAHQVASNPLPPQTRKPGSVGQAAGPQITILDPEGEPVEADRVGEVAIRGENVFSGYAGLQQPEVGAGWFRTGDLGWVDSEGYLYLSGRKKEIINRGGETIAPREIDEVLLGHPAIRQALAFAVPDSRLGEQVAAAVVVEPGTTVAEVDLRTYVAERLSSTKVPRRIIVMDEIPRGPTGKLARIGLAERLGLSDLDGPSQPRPDNVAPRTAVEKLLGGIWLEVLDLEEVGVLDRFLDIGGDSLLAVRLLGRVRDALGLEPSMIAFFDRATIAAQSELIEDLLLADESRPG